MRMNKEQLSRLLSSLGGKWVVSSTAIWVSSRTTPSLSKKKTWKIGRFEDFRCLLNDEAERLKDEVREYLRQRYS